MERPHRSCSATLFLPAAGSFHGTSWRPAVDIYRNPRGWLVKFDLAGVRLEDIHLEIHGRALRLQGVRRDWLLEEGCCYHSLEIAYSQFERRLELPENLETASIRTEYREGMLLVRIETETERT